MIERTIETATKRYPLLLGDGAVRVLPSLLRSLSCPPGTKLFIVTDDTVAPLYLDEVRALLAAAEYDVYAYVIPSGEAAKSFDHYYACQTAALQCGLDRRSVIIALGGGVVGDLAGFVAATYMRGIRYIQMPTTLLAHDSAVGGKVAINHPLGKNMIGAFHQPEAVVYDTSFLRTLPERELRSGFAEVIKHALIRDRRFYDWLRAEIKTLADLRGEKLAYCIEKGIDIKASVVREDEKETGVRAHLNFGHTLGHALESELGYGALTHGEAVAVGMLFAVFVSERFYGRSFAEHRLADWFAGYGFPVSLPTTVQTRRLLEKMKGDKKRTPEQCGWCFSVRSATWKWWNSKTTTCSRGWTSLPDRGERMIRGIRGAITVDRNDAEEIVAATETLLREMIRANDVAAADVSFVLISVTDDITAAFPAQALRRLDGWTYVPVMCTREIPVPGSLPRCIRVMMTVATEKQQEEICHVYLKGAVVLRPDLSLTKKTEM